MKMMFLIILCIFAAVCVFEVLNRPQFERFNIYKMVDGRDVPTYYILTNNVTGGWVWLDERGTAEEAEIYIENAKVMKWRDGG